MVLGHSSVTPPAPTMPRPYRTSSHHFTNTGRRSSLQTRSAEPAFHFQRGLSLADAGLLLGARVEQARHLLRAPDADGARLLLPRPPPPFALRCCRCTRRCGHFPSKPGSGTSSSSSSSSSRGGDWGGGGGAGGDVMARGEEGAGRSVRGGGGGGVQRRRGGAPAAGGSAFLLRAGYSAGLGSRRARAANPLPEGDRLPFLPLSRCPYPLSCLPPLG